MEDAAEKHLTEAIELNADQLAASLNAMTDAVYEADRQGNADGAAHKMQWWEAFIATQSRINALVEKAQVALQVTKEATKEAWSRLQNNHDVDKWLNRLSRHGVAPFQVRQQTDETVAIIADLVMWKARDPMYSDDKNPWPDVFSIYAERIIARPTGDRKVKLSRLGTPKPATRGASGDYLFTKLVPDDWEERKAMAAASSKANITKIESSMPKMSNSQFKLYVKNMLGGED